MLVVQPVMLLLKNASHCNTKSKRACKHECTHMGNVNWAYTATPILLQKLQCMLVYCCWAWARLSLRASFISRDTHTKDSVWGGSNWIYASLVPLRPTPAHIPQILPLFLTLLSFISPLSARRSWLQETHSTYVCRCRQIWACHRHMLWHVTTSLGCKTYVAENFQLERYLSSCGRKRIVPHLSATSMWTNFCSCLKRDVKMLPIWDNSVHVTSPNTRNYTYTSTQIRLTDLQLNNSICQCLIFYPYPLLTLFFPCFCGGCCCFEPWWSCSFTFTF